MHSGRSVLMRARTFSGSSTPGKSCSLRYFKDWSLPRKITPSSITVPFLVNSRCSSWVFVNVVSTFKESSVRYLSRVTWKTHQHLTYHWWCQIWLLLYKIRLAQIQKNLANFAMILSCHYVKLKLIKNRSVLRRHNSSLMTNVPWKKAPDFDYVWDFTFAFRNHLLHECQIAKKDMAKPSV